MFEKYSAADARFAVNHITVNWNEQAAKSAASYLDYGSFSRQSLIDQLEFEGFTPSASHLRGQHGPASEAREFAGGPAAPRLSRRLAARQDAQG